MTTKSAPKLLYLAYHFPPAPAIGCVRSWNTAKGLAKLGWDVTVVTPAPALWRAPEEPERAAEQAREAGLRQILTGHSWPMLAPEEMHWGGDAAAWLVGGACRVLARGLGLEPSAGWTGPAQRACAALKPDDVDLILATGGPYISFRLARRLARRLGRPFVLDYRDPWTGNPHAAPGRAPRIPSVEEAALVRACAAATVVSPSWAELIGSTFGVSHKLSVVTNGFDPSMFTHVEPARFDHFSIVYAGTLYPPKRVLDPVLQALREFVARRPDWDAKLHYYGDYGEPVRLAARRLGLSDHVAAHGRVTREQALRAQKGADLLVVVSSVEEDGALADRGVVTGKVFDCMALGRPTLVVAPRGSDLYGIAAAAGGMRCFTGSDVGGMTRFLEDTAAGRVPPERDRRAYRWDALAARMDGVLWGALTGAMTR